MSSWKMPLLISAGMFFLFLAYIFILQPKPAFQTSNLQEPAVVLEPVKQVRNVTDDTILQAPELESAYLERLPAREPPPAPVRAPKPKPLERPRVISAGILKIGTRTLYLADIDPIPLDQQCPSQSGEDWPCGMFARTEMLQFIRGRPIECMPSDEQGEQFTTRCSLDAFDISGWLVLTGWAKPKGNYFEKELAEAQNKKRGIWRRDRP